MDRGLAAAYRRCRVLHRRHGRSYYLATRLLPPAQRPAVHALYGFTRTVDEIVDQTGTFTQTERVARLQVWSDQFWAGLAGTPVHDPVLPAVLDTIRRYRLGHDDFTAFLKSMAMDLTVTGYRTYDELLSYMEGSAAAIGSMLLPILAPPGATPQELARAREPARSLGIAFQLTNFIRDVAEDLHRGRVYLPQEDLARFGVTRAQLLAAAREGRAGAGIRALVRFQVRRAHQHYRAAACGVPLLAVSAQPCIRAAFYLYFGILVEVARADFDVFARRAVVPRHRRLAMAWRSLRTPPGVPPDVPECP